MVRKNQAWDMIVKQTAGRIPLEKATKVNMEERFPKMKLRKLIMQNSNAIKDKSYEREEQKHVIYV